ncbi:hypothetical protein AKO1_000897 [Acrasis kona]|uniref:Uncharacterized protein n=1 Tax=Acrasis kona TaxID=1008807 RepID=A0AAW2ZPQ7_9EUKA
MVSMSDKARAPNQLQLMGGGILKVSVTRNDGRVKAVDATSFAELSSKLGEFFKFDVKEVEYPLGETGSRLETRKEFCCGCQE